jgi:Asp-tRNA(Asn)/Glu-tRNA(Gln) amidotransferase A subunit family amidase
MVSVSIAPLKPSRGRNIDDKPMEPWHISVKGHITRTVRDSAALFELAYQLEEARSWHQRWAPVSAAQGG